jgi:anaerobic magnesium-protoporphyrin IX monomethyl ester cyclase
MKVLFVEPPKELWFVMGEYLPPPLGILGLAAYLESHDKNIDLEVIDCQTRRWSWKELERHIESSNPDVVAPSTLATCNVYTALRVAETAKKVNSSIKTVVGGQHFTATAQESLEVYPEIDFVVRGEGEQTLAELLRELEKKKPKLSKVDGISFKHGDKVIHNPPRPLIENLDTLPLPGYHFVEEYMSQYHFAMMAGAKQYSLIEGSRGCPHKCTFCSQWKHWGGTWRIKSAKRVADEFEYCYSEFGSEFLWLTDDNFGLGKHANDLCDEIAKRGMADDIMWFMQVRSDDIVNHKESLPKMRKAGNRWMLVGIESGDVATLESFHKEIHPDDAQKAMRLLKENDIFAQATLIIGQRKDSAESIAKLREFVNNIDPDLAIFMILTPFPGTELYETARQNGWLEDSNWANYDMVHAIMPTETLSRKAVQEELYNCYRSFYGSASRRLKGLFSPNRLKRKTYRYLASQGLLKALRDLV